MISCKKVFSAGSMALTALLAALLFIQPLHAQTTQSADKIIAVVGRNKIILQSELEGQMAQAKQQDPTGANDATVKCQLLQQMIAQKILSEQAERDSVIVSDDEVEGNLDNRIRYYIRAYGSKEKLEQVAGRTIYQLKEDMRDGVKEDLIAQKMSGDILKSTKVTPAEVKLFFDKIPVDSLPLLPATVEIGQIVIDPPVTKEMNDYARQKLEDIRKQIVDGGKTFETMAGIYSEDPGSRDNGGRYNDVARNGSGWAPEFITAAFRLQNGEVSQVVKTRFGYHIIQMIQRKGEEADVRHILIRPQVTTEDFAVAINKLDSIRAELITGKLSFPEAVGKYSTDEAAKRTGGMVADPATGSTDIDIAKLDPAMVLIIDSLQPGAYSHPHVFNNESGDRSCRIVYMRGRTKPHKANLTDDYGKLQEFALSQKKMIKMQEWIAHKLPTYYLKVDAEYQQCSTLKNWLVASSTSDK
ncbi:MAG: peptidylprolyl isomerase [Taibaiella sp.]|nr:peptidylprolyl isomerase [Taibaiella sp.]